MKKGSENGFNPNNGVNWEQIAKYFAGECTEEERLQIQAWVNEDLSRKETLDSLQAVWVEGGKHPKEFDARSLWNKVAIRSKIIGQPAEADKKRVYTQASPFWKSRPLNFAFRIAAAILLLISTSYVVIKLTDTQKTPAVADMRELSTRSGERAQFLFSDGTRIWLNAASNVRFPNRFVGKKREIYLDGEAFFEVAHNEEMPFIVRTEKAVVQVLGTEFNVRARKEDKRVAVVVATGRVLFQRRDSTDVHKVVLIKGERSVLTEEGHVSTPQKVNVQKYLAWIKGALVFERMPMKDVVAELERRYGTRFRLADSALGAIQLTGSFQRESLDEVLHTISVTTNLKYAKSINEIVFSKR